MKGVGMFRRMISGLALAAASITNFGNAAKRSSEAIAHIIEPKDPERNYQRPSRRRRKTTPVKHGKWPFKLYHVTRNPDGTPTSIAGLKPLSRKKLKQLAPQHPLLRMSVAKG